jgi:amino acid permease
MIGAESKDIRDRYDPVRSPRNYVSPLTMLVQGLSNFRNSQAFIGGFSTFAQTFVYAFFSFGGIELVAVAAGESVRPYKTVPRAIKATFFRIVLFYILTILTMGLCINYQDPTLLSAAFGGLWTFLYIHYFE